jgi:hyaluronan synthase
MLVYLLEIREWLRSGRVYPFAVFMTLVWALWWLKITLTRFYQPWPLPFDTTASVIVPVVDEPVALFRYVLTHIVEQQPFETIVVINGPPNPPLEHVCDALGVKWIWTGTPGKRNATRIGVEAASGEIAVLVDS